MVTWGPNTTHTFGTPAPAPGALGGTPAPSTGGLFGSNAGPAPPPPTGLFGAPAPAPGGSLFGNPPAAAPAGGLFGTPAAAPSTGGYGFGSPAPAPGSGSLFGSFGTPAPAPSTLGGSSSLFGAPAMNPHQQSQQPIPAQAALQAHMDASARQEAERVRSALERLHGAYAGNALPNSGVDSNFVAVVYNPLTPEQRQLQWIHGMGNGGHILAPDRPHQVSEKQWKEAVVNNPDPENYMPQALLGAVALQGRISWQQDRATEFANHATTLRKSQESIKERSEKTQQEVEERARRHLALRKRLLDVMRKVELARCMNQQIQPDEFKALERLTSLVKEVDRVRGVLVSLQDRARTQTTTSTTKVQSSGLPDTTQLLPVLKEQRQKLEKLTLTANRDTRDLTLIHSRIGTGSTAMPRA